MNRNATVIVLCGTLLAMSFAYAQSAGPATGTTGAAAAPDSMAPARAAAERRGLAGADARHCLEFPTNLQIITCAEKYRPRRSGT